MNSNPKYTVHAAIKDDNLRKTIRIMNNIREAHEMLAELPQSYIEAIRDELHEMADERTGPRGALKKAWCQFAQSVLDDARTRSEQGVLGLYGRLYNPKGKTK